MLWVLVMERVRFRDLSFPLQAGFVLVFVFVFLFLFSFVLGFVGGLLGFL